VEQINRSSFSTDQPKVYTGAKSEFSFQAQARSSVRRTPIAHQLHTDSGAQQIELRPCGPP